MRTYISIVLLSTAVMAAEPHVVETDNSTIVFHFEGDSVLEFTVTQKPGGALMGSGRCSKGTPLWATIPTNGSAYATLHFNDSGVSFFDFGDKAHAAIGTAQCKGKKTVSVRLTNGLAFALDDIPKDLAPKEDLCRTDLGPFRSFCGRVK